MDEKEVKPIEIQGEVVEEKKIEEGEITENGLQNTSEVNNENVDNEEETVSEDVSEANGINISEEVVAAIAGIAAFEVNGVACMNGGFVDGLSEMLGKKTKGVKVQVGDKETIIDISLTVEYGFRIPDVAWEVQNKVKTQVESMTGLKGVVVNIYVQGLTVAKKKPEVVNHEVKTEE